MGRDRVRVLLVEGDAIDHKALERTVRAAQAQLELQMRILGSLGEMVLLIDRNGQVIFANDAIEQTLGYCVAEVLGSGWWDVLIPAAEVQREFKTQALARIHRKRPPTAYDLEVRTKSGTRIWTEWTEHLGPADGLICVGRDITERRQTTLELARHHDQLEQLVNARTAELQQAYARVQQEVAERTRAEQSERRSKTFLRSVIDGITDPILVIGRDHDVRLANRAGGARVRRARSVTRWCSGVAHPVGDPVGTVRSTTSSALLTHGWPGNVRELANVLAYAVVNSAGGLIRIEDLRLEVTGPSPGPAQAKIGRKRKLTRKQVDRALVTTGGNKAKAARLLGVGRSTIYRYLAGLPL